MATPDVNQNLLAELEDMGFPHAKAIKALHFSGNSGIEDAINWIIENEDDTDIDDIPSVTVVSSDISGSVEMNLQQLRDQARKNREEEHKKLERDREKERISSGKELLKAKRMAEENKRKRYIASYEADKEERKRAMERIRQKLQQDKAERKRGLGEDGISAKPESCLPEKIESPTVVDHGSVPVNYTWKRAGDPMKDCLRSLKRQHLDDDAQVKRAFQTLLIYVRNVANHPGEEKFRRIRLTSPAFQNKVGRFEDGVEFLELCGFEKHGDFLILPREEVDLATLKEAWDALHSALTNPFFGLLSRNAVDADTNNWRPGLVGCNSSITKH